LDFDKTGIPAEPEIGMKATDNSYQWYALKVRTRYEDIVRLHLHCRGYELFLPMRKWRRRWSDRFKELELPLFPGYVFCRFNAMNRLPILTTPGVVQVIGVGKVPVPIDETEIAALKTTVKSGLPIQPWPFPQIGQRVKIEHGPLRGVEGILLGFRGGQRLVLSITLLQRSVAVQTSEAWVTLMPSDQRAFSGSVSRRLNA
jgi:transcription antitermination factor NusG